jgi:hypothetical protein
MANAAEIADLITAGMQGSTGADDVGFHLGRVVTWDELSQVNSIRLNNAVLTNLKAINSGIGVQYQPGDSVVIMRKQTQYFVLGKVSAPGAPTGNLIQSAIINANQSTTATTFGDLATPGPSVTLNIGTSRRALVFANSGVDSPGVIGSAKYAGGWFTLSVTNENKATIGPVGAATPFYAGGGIFYEQDFIATLSQTWLVTASDGLQRGRNTFTLKYMADNTSTPCFFSGRNIAVIPF